MVQAVGTYEVMFETEAWILEGMRKVAITRIRRPTGPAEAYTLVSDEGAHLGGEGSAPTPLTYFVAGVAFCVLTQLSRCARDLKVPIEQAQAKVTARFRRTGSVLQGTARGECTGFEI